LDGETMNEAAGRVFASHYQLVICDDPTRSLTDEENWDDSKIARGFAGHPSFRMVGTEAHLNDHWVELVLSEQPPDRADWQRITCVDFVSDTGKIHVMSVVDTEPVLSLAIPPGQYSVFVAGNNLGVDQQTLGEEAELSNQELSQRRDLEWYRVFVVPGSPARTGRLPDT
jgi:hypothetical protein